MDGYCLASGALSRQQDGVSPWQRYWKNMADTGWQDKSRGMFQTVSSRCQNRNTDSTGQIGSVAGQSGSVAGQTGQNEAGSRLQDERTNRQSVTCPICFKHLTSSLTRHLVVHTGEKSHCCNICHCQFGRKSSLMRHIMKVHSVTPDTQ